MTSVSVQSDARILSGDTAVMPLSFALSAGSNQKLLKEVNSYTVILLRVEQPGKEVGMNGLIAVNPQHIKNVYVRLLAID